MPGWLWSVIISVIVLVAVLARPIFRRRKQSGSSAPTSSGQLSPDGGKGDSSDANNGSDELGEHLGLSES